MLHRLIVHQAQTPQSENLLWEGEFCSFLSNFSRFRLFCISFQELRDCRNFKFPHSGSKIYFKECFAPHHRLSSQTVAFNIENFKFDYPLCPERWRIFGLAWWVGNQARVLTWLARAPNAPLQVSQPDPPHSRTTHLTPASRVQ